jgi:hypothetical protein
VLEYDWWSLEDLATRFAGCVWSEWIERGKVGIACGIERWDGMRRDLRRTNGEAEVRFLVMMGGLSWFGERVARQGEAGQGYGCGGRGGDCLGAWGMAGLRGG